MHFEVSSNPTNTLIGITRITPIAAAVALTLGLIGPSFGHEAEEGKGQLGRVAFASTCDAKVQKELQRAVAPGPRHVLG